MQECDVKTSRLLKSLLHTPINCAKLLIAFFCCFFFAFFRLNSRLPKFHRLIGSSFSDNNDFLTLLTVFCDCVSTLKLKISQHKWMKFFRRNFFCHLKKNCDLVSFSMSQLAMLCSRFIASAAKLRFASLFLLTPIQTKKHHHSLRRAIVC